MDNQPAKPRQFRAAQVPNSVLCSKVGGGPCEGADNWWVVSTDRTMTTGPNCERHAKALANELNEHS